MIFGDRWESTTGYARMGKMLARDLSKDHKVIYVGGNYGCDPTDIEVVTKEGVIVVPMYPPEGSNEYLIRLMTYLNKYSPDVLFVIGDAIIRESLQHLNLINYNDKIKKIFYSFVDSEGLPSAGIEFMNKMDIIIPPSKFGEDQMKREGFEVTEPVLCPVDKTVFKPIKDLAKKNVRRKYNFGKEHFIVFNYMRFQRRKNPFHILEAAIKVGLEHKHVKFFFHWVKYNDYPHMNAIDYLDRVIPKRIDLPEGFKWQDVICIHDKPLEYEEVAELIAASDLCLSASSGEGFNLMIPESLYSHVPILVSDNSTAVEITNGRAGLIEAPHPIDAGYGTWHYASDADNIYSELNLAITDKEHYNLMKEDAIKYREEFDLDSETWIKKMRGIIDGRTDTADGKDAEGPEAKEEKES